MKAYKKFQIGWPIFCVIIPVQILITWLYINQSGGKPMSSSSFFLATAVMATVVLLFYRLTIKVDDKFVTLLYGIGVIKKRIQLTQVKSVRQVTNLHLYGWGIRITPQGMIFNISGKEGVGLVFNNSGEYIRIGTENARELEEEITKRLTRNLMN